LQFLGTVVPGGAPGSDGGSTNSLAASGSPNPPTADSGFHSPPPPISPALPQATALRESPPREPPPNSLAMTPAITQPFDPLLSPPAKNESVTRFGPSKSPFGAPEVDPRVAVSPSQHDLTPAPLSSENHHAFDSGPATSFTSLDPRPRDDVPSTDLHHAEPAELALAIWNRLSGPTLYDQTKTVLAIIGTLSVIIIFLRFGSREKERYHEEEGE
jgi:hypothetical protein